MLIFSHAYIGWSLDHLLALIYNIIRLNFKVIQNHKIEMQKGSKTAIKFV